MAVTTQPLFSHCLSSPNAAAFGGWPAVVIQMGLSAISRSIWAADGAFAKFLVNRDVAPGSGNSVIYTFRNITQSTSVAVTLSNAQVTNRDIGSTLAVTRGDLLQLEISVTGTPAAATTLEIVCEHTGTNANETAYTIHHAPGNGGLGSGSIYYLPGPFVGTTFSTTTPPVSPNVLAISGNVTALCGNSSVAIAGGESWDFYLVYDGVLQDGAGGTVDTKCSVTGSLPATATKTFTLPVVAGKTLTLKLDHTGTPATTRPGASICIVSTNANESQVSAHTTNGSSTTVLNYTQFINGTAGWGVTTEANVAQPAPISTFTYDQFYLITEAALGSPDTRTYDLRKNSTSPSGTPTIQITSAGLTGSDLTGAVASADLDTLDLRGNPAGTSPFGSGGDHSWSFRVRLGDFATSGITVSSCGVGMGASDAGYCSAFIG